jgi:hypothetical protein
MGNALVFNGVRYACVRHGRFAEMDGGRQSPSFTSTSLLVLGLHINIALLHHVTSPLRPSVLASGCFYLLIRHLPSSSRIYHPLEHPARLDRYRCRSAR